MEILQSIVVGHPDNTDKFGQTQVQTQLSAYLEKAKALAAGTDKTTLSASQVMKGMNYSIPKKEPASNIQSTSKEVDSTEGDDDEKVKVKTDDEGFKIPQGITHCKKKRLDADKHSKIVSRILARELNPSGSC